MILATLKSKSKPQPPTSVLKPGQFAYNVSQSSQSSATAWKDGKMVRTIFGNKAKTAGRKIEWWDGKDDFGAQVTSGAYVIKGANTKLNAVWQGAVGNNSTTQTGSTVHRGFERVFGVAIAGSYMYLAIGYNEGRNSQMKVSLSDPHVNIRAFSNSSGSDADQESNHVCTDGTTIYWAGVDPFSTSKSVSFVFGTLASNDSEVLFSSGTSVDLVRGRTYSKAISAVTNTSGRITGMAVQPSGNFLFVARKGLNNLYVLNKTTGALAQTISISNVNKVSVDSSNNLWVQAGSTATKYTVNGDGTITAAGVTVTGLISVEGMGCNSTNLWICDGLTSQQIKVYNSSGSSIKTLGQSGGYATNATVANDKFYFNDPANRINTSAIAFAGDGSYWVLDGGNYRVQKYNASDVYQDRIQYMPHLWSAGAFKDGSIVRVFGDYLEFADTPTTAIATSWTHTKNWGYNVPANRDDEYKRLAHVNKFSNGRTYALQPNGSGWEFVELVEGGALRLTGVMITQSHAQMYPDQTIRRQNASNTVTNSPQIFYKRPFTFNGSNNPVLGTEVIVQQSPNETAADPLYWGTRPTGYSAGEQTSDGAVISWDPNADAYGSTGHHLGKIKDGAWIWKTMFSVGAYHHGEFPTGALFEEGNSVGNAGGRIFTIDDLIFQQYHGEFWRSWNGEPGQVNKVNIFNTDGIMLGQFGSTYWDSKNLGEAAPQMVGNGFYISVIKVGSDYYLYQNDESFHGGITRWKITFDLVETWNTVINVVTPVPSVPVDYIDLLAGVGRNGVALTNGNGWDRGTSPTVTISESTNYWKVSTGQRTPDLFSTPDLYAEFGANTAKTEDITRVLPSETVSAWKLNFQAQYDRHYPNIGTASGQYFEVLDIAGKVLARFYWNIVTSGSFPITGYGNGTVIATGSETDMRFIIERFRDVEISCNAGGVTFKYHNYSPITVAILDGTADWTKPAKVRIRFFYASGLALQKKFGIKDFQYTRTPTATPAGGGIFYAETDIPNWSQRIKDKKVFFNKGDVKTNSPGIGARFYQKANELVNNPYIERYTGPTYYQINNSGTKIPLLESDYIRDFSYPESQKKGDRIFCAALLGRLLEGWDDVNANKYKNAAKIALLDMFSQNIMQFPSYASTWPANGTRWNPAGHHGYQNPMFVFGQIFKNGIKAYDLIKSTQVSGSDLFSGANKTALGDCFHKAALYMADLNNDELDGYLTNRNPLTNINLTGYTIIGDQGKDTWRIFDGGPFVSRMARHWENRIADQFYFGLLEGVRSNNTYLINSFYVFFKEWVTYSSYKVGADVFPGEMERGNNSSFREHAFSYAYVMVGIMLSGGRIFDKWLKENPNPAYSPLLDFTTSGGQASDTAGGPKNINAIARTLLKMANGELNITYGGERLDGFLATANNLVTNKDWYWTEDTTLAALMNRKYSDAWLRKSYERSHSGSRPYPSTGDGSGAWETYSGWGGTEYELFFSAYFEGTVE